MANAILSADHFHNEEAAFGYVEKHLWPTGPVCPRCGAPEEKIGRLAGKSSRPGLYKCYQCRKPFTVRIGSIFEDSHLPMRLWLQAIHLLVSSKKGISTRQIQRTLKCSMKTAWFLTHRIREIMKPAGDAGPLGGKGKVVEADETYFGPKEYRRNMQGKVVGKQGPGGKSKIMSLVERGGAVRSIKVETFTTAEVRKVLQENVDLLSRIHTDEAGAYVSAAYEFAKHETVKHGASEYVRGDVTTNTVEGFFSIFKRGMVGVYQHCESQHLQRYLTEFDFRYSNRERLGIDDVARASRALRGAKGRRLTYRTADEQSLA